MLPILIKNRYSFSLANSHHWAIQFSDDSTSTVEQMANIMNLGYSDNESNANLIYTRAIIQDSHFINNFVEHIGDLPEKGWVNNMIGRVIFWTHPDVNSIICDIGHKSDPVGEALKIGDSLFAFYEYEMKFGGLPFHSALIEKNGDGILLAAKGETGKSTCCRRIPEP